MRQDYILLQHAIGVCRRYLTGLQLWIEKRTSGSLQPHLQRDQLAFERHIRLDEVLRIQSPTFGVGAVEGVADPRQRHAMLQHGVELQLMSRPRFVRGQRPGRGIGREVVVLFRGGLARTCGNIQR